jgi:hypothetical protein
LRAAQLQERYDVAIMSTKGMSVTASRQLLDSLTPYVNNILVLHDFDRSGFSICGTLGTDSRRYVFRNKPPMVDIGLRLADVEAMDLQSEPIAEVDPNEWIARATTLRRHGATPKEVEFLRTRRVELNAMTSRELVNFVEIKLAEHGVEKMIPGNDVLERHARRIIGQRLTQRAIAKIAADIAEQAKVTALPDNLRDRVSVMLKTEPHLPWDAAVALILKTTEGAS